MNDREWKYISDVAKTFGGEGEVPQEMRARDFLDVIKSMTEGYVFSAAVIADQRASELPIWRRKATKQQFLAAARQKASKALEEAELWMATDIFKLAREGTALAITAAIKRGSDPNSRNDRGWTPVMCAAAFNSKPDAVYALLQDGADINARVEYEPMMLIQYAPEFSRENQMLDASDSWTPLMCAASFNENTQVLNALIVAGADVNARIVQRKSRASKNLEENEKAPQGMTVLMLAAQHTKNHEVIHTLTKAGADVLARDGSGWTALMYAAQNNASHEVITTLILAGSEINAQNLFGGTALKIAKDFNQHSPRVIAALVWAGTKIDTGLTQ